MEVEILVFSPPPPPKQGLFSFLSRLVVVIMSIGVSSMQTPFFLPDLSSVSVLRCCYMA